MARSASATLTESFFTNLFAGWRLLVGKQENVYVTADYLNYPKYVNTLLQQQRRKAN
jgi:hypothetical protein